MRIDFWTTPPVGTVMMLDEQRYEIVLVEPYQRLDGARSRLLHWRSHCPTCGAEFEVKTGLKASQIHRRCPDHLAVLVPVGRRGAAVKIKVIEPGLGPPA